MPWCFTHKRLLVMKGRVFAIRLCGVHAECLRRNGSQGGLFFGNSLRRVLIQVLGV